MKKTRTAIYFQKKYCLLVHSLIMNQRMSVSAFSNNSCQKEILDRTCSYNINQIVYINCIDVIRDGITTPDNETVIHFNVVGERMIKKNDIAVIRFDMTQEKIVKPQSSVLYSKQLSEGKGVLHYKFINLKTRTLTMEQYELNRQRKAELEIQTSRDEHFYKIQQLTKILEQKDELIQKIQKKIESLMIQNRKLKDQTPDNRQSSKEKAISLNVRVNTMNDNIRKQNDKLHRKIQEIQEQNQQLMQQVNEYAKKEETFERELNLLRKQLEKQQKVNESRSKPRGRTVSYVAQPSFMRNSNAGMDPYQSNLNWVEQQQGPTRITVNQPLPTRSRNNSFIQQQQQQSEITARSNKNNSPQNAQHKALQNKSSMYASNYISQVSQKSIPQSHAERQKSPAQNESPNPLKQSDVNETALQRRISMQKDDLKWTSIIFQRNQQIQILKRKLELRTNQVKNLQKQVQKAKVQLKKKETQIKQMRRQSKKNLFFGDSSSRQLGKNRTDIQLEFQKMQAEHDSEKVRLQQEIQAIDRQKEVQEKQVKRLKAILSDKQQRQKATQAKYNQLKKFTQKKQEQFIQYRQKAQQYDLMNIKSKEVQAALKTLDAKYQNLQKQNKKYIQINSSLKVRLSDLQRDWQRLKKAQRQFESAKNSNINLVRSVQQYESRYNQLKKYCIKIESSYNKFVTSKKKPNPAQQSRQDKEIQQKFIELSKKMQQTQVQYYRQQIQDLNDQRSFLTTYFQKKIKEERDRIFDDKQIPQDQKRSILVQKQKQIQRTLYGKLQEVRSKISKLQRTQEQVLNRIKDSKQSGFNKSIPEQLRIMEKKLSMFNQRQQERIIQRKNLKETIANLSDQLKKVSSSAHLQLQQLQTQQLQQYALSKNIPISKNTQMNLSMIYNERSQQQRSMQIEQARQKESSYQKVYEQNRKMNTNLVKENGELKMKNQKLTMDMQKIERRAQQRQKQLDQTFKKSQIEFKLKNDRLTEQIQKQSAQIQNLKLKFTDAQKAVAAISEQSVNLSKQLQQKQQQIQRLEEKIIIFQQRIEDYEKGERLMLEQVAQIKKQAEVNQQQLFQLIEQRSENFTRIQKVKEMQVQKLKGIIRELEVKIEAQMFQNIQSKEKIEQLKSNYQKLEKKAQEDLLKQQIKYSNQEAAFEKLYVKEFQTTKQNEILQQNLFQISTQIQNKELQIVQLTFELTQMTKELQVYKKTSEKYEQMQYKYKDDIKGLQALLDDKIQQIRAFEDKYKEFQMEIEYTSKDMQRLALSNLKYQTEAKQFQEKYMLKQEEIINVKKEFSMFQIKMHMQQINFTNLQNQNNALHHQIQELNKEIQRLNQVNNNAALRVSRKASNADECPSPGRKKNLKRGGTLEVPEVSMIGAGGITPILPPTPNPLSRKISENPFEPKEQQRRGRLLRGTSMEQPNDLQQEIAIHVQSPSTSKMPIKSPSNINIDLGEMEDSVRLTNMMGLQNQRPSKKNETRIQIRQQTQENQQNSGGFGKNFNFQDSKEDYVGEAEAYEEKIRQLQRQLNRVNQENQRLNEELTQLQKKNEQLIQQIQTNTNQNPNQLSQTHNQNQNRSPSLGISRRKSILDVPPLYPKQNSEQQSNQGKLQKIQNQAQAQPSQNNPYTVRRSNSGVQLNSSRDGVRLTNTANAANIGQLQQKWESAQVQNQYLKNQLDAIKAELEQMTKNNQRLIQQAELCGQTIQDLNNKLEEANFEIEQAKNFIQFQQLYHRERETVNLLKLQIQELNAEIFAKQEHIATLMKENCEIMEQVNEARTQSVNTNQHKTKLEQKVKQLTQTIQKLKIQYRKYEQSAELEIVKLHETIDSLKLKINQKEDEFVVLGEELLNVQNEKQDLTTYLQQNGKQSKKRQYQQSQLQQRCNQLQNQLDKTDQTRKNLYNTIKKLQLQLTQKDEKQKTSSNQLALMMKKYQIKLQANQQQIQMVQAKLAQKEKVINALKNQIGLYNEECIQLKNLNDQLSYQSTKVEKELKDIMVTYSSQIDQYKQVIAFKQKEIINLTSIVKEKQNQYHNVLKNLRTIQKQKEIIHCDYIDVKNNLERLKNIKSKETNDLYIQIQYKNSQCQKLKIRVQKLQEQIQQKQQIIKHESQKYEIRLKSYQQKLQRYASLIEGMQLQFKKLQERPTFQIHEQVLFQNQVLKNRIDQLQQQLHAKGNPKDKEELVYLQFRKYKVNKDREIQDLNAEMEKYGIKINELQQSMFLLKRQNDSLKRQNQSLHEAKEDLTIELEDLKQSFNQVEKELQFYKKRKLLDMQKLLNDTQ